MPRSLRPVPWPCRIGVLVACAVAAVAAEDLPRPPVEDPFGLGERLALLDHLRKRQIAVPDGASYEQLVAIYWQHQRASEAESPDAHERARTAERCQRLRAQLTELGATAPADADEAALQAMVQRLRAAQTTAAVDEAVRRGERRDRPESAEEAQRFADQDHVAASDRVARLDREIGSARGAVDRVVRTREAAAAEAKALAERVEAAAAATNAAIKRQNEATEAYNAQIRRTNKVDDATRKAVDKAEQEVKAERQRLEQAQAALQAQLAKVEALEQQARREGERSAQIEHERTRAAEEAAAAARRAREATSAPATPSPTGLSAAPPATAGEGFSVGRITAAVVLVQVDQRGTGTGFFVDDRGRLVTNAHVVGAGATRCTALWDPAQRREPAALRVLAVDADKDLALLQLVDVPGAGTPFLALGEVYDLSHPLAAVGFPLAGGLTAALGTATADIVVTRGTLTAVRRSPEGIPQWLQHDCSIASGNSGGPLIDVATGAVVGINTAVIDPHRVGAAGGNINLAIPARTVRARFELP